MAPNPCLSLKTIEHTEFNGKTELSFYFFAAEVSFPYNCTIFKKLYPCCLLGDGNNRQQEQFRPNKKQTNSN